MSHASSLIALSLLLASTAFATPAIAVDPIPEPSSVEESGLPFSTDLQVGALTGSTSVAEVDDVCVGLGVAAMLQLADLALVGEFDHARIGGSRDEGGPARGTLTRGGISLRHRLTNIAPGGDAMRADIWLEVGAGRQRIAWREGGTLTRNDVTLGVALQLGGLFDDADGQWRSFGPYFAVRTIIARAPVGDAMSTCGGPCDAPGQPLTNDLSTLLSFGMHWGS